MRRIALIALLCVSASPLRAQDHFTFWSFLKQSQVIGRCADNSPQHTAAAARLEELDVAISKLAKFDDHAAVVDSLYALLKTECFHMASEVKELPAPRFNMRAAPAWHFGPMGASIVKSPIGEE